MHRTTSLAAVGGLATALAWGGMFTIAKTAFFHLRPFQLTAARFIVATIAFMTILALKEGPRALIPGRRAGALWLMGTIGFAGFNLLMYAGLAYSAPQTISLVMATLPMVTLFVMWAARGSALSAWCSSSPPSHSSVSPWFWGTATRPLSFRVVSAWVSL